jgi:transposase
MHVGIDVAKDTLAFAIHETGRQWSVPNTPAQIRQAVAALQAQAAGPWRVALEATGRWDLPLARALAAAGAEVWRLNPKQARDAARAWGQRAKTDPLDAQLLARYATTLAGAPPPLPSEALQGLQELRAAREVLVAERAGYTLRLGTATAPAVRRVYRAQVRHLTSAITTLEAQLFAALAADPQRAHQAALLQSIPGVGALTAATLLIELPELASASPRALASLVGVAPHACDSGQRSGPRHCAGGRAHVRRALWMAALSGRRYNPVLRALAARLAARGKPFKVIMVALVHKLIHLARAVLHHDTPWRPPVGA